MSDDCNRPLRGRELTPREFKVTVSAFGVNGAVVDDTFEVT